MADEEIRQKYMELQIANEQLKQMQEQLQMVEAKRQEIADSVENVESIKNCKTGAPLLTPIADGIFIKGELKDNQGVIVNAGANVCVTKTIEDAKKMLKEKEEELGNYIKELETEFETAVNEAKSLEQELGTMMKKTRKNV